MTTPPKTPDELIEAAARLIDPRAFEWLDTVGGIECASAIAEAKHKAREIAALYGAGDGGELVVVPRKPTMAMLNAAIDVDSYKLGDISPLGFRCSPQQLFERCWAAMIALSHLPSGGDYEGNSEFGQSGSGSADVVETAPLHDTAVKLLADYDAAVAGCPVNNPKFARPDRCAVCTATARDNCGRDVSAMWSLINALRQALASPTALAEGEQ